MAWMRSHRVPLRQIFWTFFRIGPITFGGGYAMIPLFEREVVRKRKWIGEADIADLLAVSQTIPGAVAINAASFVGYRLAGFPGALAAIAGMMLPTFLIVVSLAAALQLFKDNAKFAAALLGMKPAVAAVIVYAGCRIAKTSITDKTTLLIALAAGLALLFHLVSPVLVIVIGALIGFALTAWKPNLPGETGKRNHPAAPDYFIGDGI